MSMSEERKEQLWKLMRIDEPLRSFAMQEAIAMNKFQEDFDGKEGWEFTTDKLLRLNSSSRIMLDGFLSCQGKPFAVIEFKAYARNPVEWRNKLLAQVRGIGAKCAIFCTPEQLYIWSTDEEIGAFPNWRSQNVYDIILSVLDKLKAQRLPLDVEAIKTLWKDVLNSIDDISHKTQIEDFIDNKLEFEEDDTSYLQLTEHSERAFFKALLGNIKQSELHRYTSINSIYRTLSSCEQGMCGIACMNDRSEVNYTEEYEKDRAEKLKHLSDTDFYRYYILSCCEAKQDEDFTMWRLYADDAKGVRITYDINNDVLKAHNSNFYLAPVCYARKNGSHPELDFIYRLLETPKGTMYLQLRQFHIWKHFFKPYEYEVEKEIRLLYIEPKSKDAVSPNINKKWINNETFGMVAPIVLFGIKQNDNVFPLVIREIMLGPKAPEAFFNKIHFKQMIEEGNISISNSPDQVITESAIYHYR